MPKAPPQSTDRARALRRNATDAERLLWKALRGRTLARTKFRRQFPIGPYVADFVCWEAKLVIELDGGQHADRTKQDEGRTRFLQSQGYRVIRFWNSDVMDSIDGVLAVIARELRS